jgi:hypothetical protein
MPFTKEEQLDLHRLSRLSANGGYKMEDLKIKTLRCELVQLRRDIGPMIRKARWQGIWAGMFLGALLANIAVYLGR